MDAVRTFSVILEPDAEGGYTAVVPALPGVVTEGATVEESLANAREAILLCIEDLQEQNLEIPQSDAGAILERIEVPI